MKKIMVIVLPLVSVFSMNKLACAENDWEYWSHYEVAGSINENLELKVKPELRFKDDFSDHYYGHVDIGLDWKIKDWFTFSPYYQHINEKKNDEWEVEYRPHLDATLKGKFLGLNLSDTNRLEYRITEDKEFFRYRNKLMVKFHGFTRFKIQPYIAEEPFYDFDANELNKNDVYAGVDFKAIKNLEAGIYYILESRKKSGDWTDVNVLETTLKYNF